MDDNRIFGPTIDMAAKALDLRARRHELIISNIANADTPGYKAFDLMVEEALSRQTAGSSKDLKLQRTRAAHMSATQRLKNDPQPKKVPVSEQISLRGDGNTVDMEREMSSLAANQLLYKISAQIVSKKVQGLRNVIQGGKR
jgi:flagellar basal-body rod protein FlgB